MQCVKVPRKSLIVAATVAAVAYESSVLWDVHAQQQKNDRLRQEQSEADARVAAATAAKAAEEARKAQWGLVAFEANRDQQAAVEVEKANPLIEKNGLLAALERQANTGARKREERMKRIRNELAKEARLELGMPLEESTRRFDTK